MTSTTSKDDVQGEGDYEAARRYDKAGREFDESGKVEPAAHEAAPESAAEADEMKRAEEAGKSHSNGEGSSSATSAGSRLGCRLAGGEISATRSPGSTAAPEAVARAGSPANASLPRSCRSSAPARRIALRPRPRLGERPDRRKE
jgi:hypothetical protein